MRHADGPAQDARSSWAAYSVWLIILAVACLAIACNTAPPPRPVLEASGSRPAQAARARRTNNESAIQAVSSLPIPKTDGGDLILDNRRDTILNWDDTGYEFIKRQSQENQNRWVRFETPVPAPLAVSAQSDAGE